MEGAFPFTKKEHSLPVCALVLCAKVGRDQRGKRVYLYVCVRGGELGLGRAEPGAAGGEAGPRSAAGAKRCSELSRELSSLQR